MERLLELLFPLVLLIGGLLAVLRLLVGRRVFEEAAGHWLYDISKAIVRFPFRLLRRVVDYAARVIRRINRV